MFKSNGKRREGSVGGHLFGLNHMLYHIQKQTNHDTPNIQAPTIPLCSTYKTSLITKGKTMYMTYQSSCQYIPDLGLGLTICVTYTATLNVNCGSKNSVTTCVTVAVFFNKIFFIFSYIDILVSLYIVHYSLFYIYIYICLFSLILIRDLSQSKPK